MLVRYCMTRDPVTVGPQDTLAIAQEKMTAGRFRRVLVVQDGVLVGILTDRDIRRHAGVEERTKVQAVMTERPLTVSPLTPVEEAARLMLAHQISGLPVLENGKLIGIITTSDILKAFLELTGAAVAQSIRINLLAGTAGSLPEAVKVITDLGGEVLGVGTYREPVHDQHVFFLRVRGVEAQVASTALQQKGYTVLHVH
ncbi:MAG: CBS and ACT domain-containing protein [Candidatus Binatia bacterium]|nr:CBS and ACT domain-containing protein [Candidatus Binatia bacterium]